MELEHDQEKHVILYMLIIVHGKYKQRTLLLLGDH